MVTSRGQSINSFLCIQTDTAHNIQGDMCRTTFQIINCIKLVVVEGGHVTWVGVVTSRSESAIYDEMAAPSDTSMCD